MITAEWDSYTQRHDGKTPPLRYTRAPDKETVIVEGKYELVPLLRARIDHNIKTDLLTEKVMMPTLS